MTGETQPAAKGVTEAATALVQKLKLIHADPKFQSVWTLAHVRNGPYTGPQYDKELAALEAALSLPAPGEARNIKSIRDCLEAIEYASVNCIKEHGQKTVNELAKVALSYLDDAALSSIDRTTLPAAEGCEKTTEHEVLLIASYCGDDNTACSDARPCPTCLGMSNVYTIPDGTLIKYQRQLSPDWLGNKHLEKLGRPTDRQGRARSEASR